MTSQTSNTGSDRSAETRGRILDAALSEFAANGLAGARTERIAASAGVNKALLYYYFDSKEKLYEAAFDMIAGRIRDSSMAAFLREATAGERLVRAALNHFDRVLVQREFQRLMQHEMVRLHRGEEGMMPVLVKKVFEPLMILFRSTVRDGIASGEVIEAEWMQFMLAGLGANVFYFLSAPVWNLVLGEDPMKVENIAARRRALVEFLGQAIFKDREHGARIAAKVLADSPMPAIDGDKLTFGGKCERS